MIALALMACGPEGGGADLGTRVDVDCLDMTVTSAGSMTGKRPTATTEHTQHEAWIAGILLVVHLSRHEHEQLRASRLVDQRGQHSGRRLVDALHVVHCDDQRLDPAGIEQRAANGWLYSRDVHDVGTSERANNVTLRPVWARDGAEDLWVRVDHATCRKR